MVHGLESSADAGYLLSLSQAALQAGFASHRFSMRGCGGAKSQPVLYHAGLTSDLLMVLREFRKEGLTPLHLAGFSLGGNVVLKLAGELAHDARDLVQGICAVSTPIDLGACVERIGQPDNWIYERRFVAKMRDRLRTMGCYSRAEYAGLRTIFEIDDRFTARAFGFGCARRYYETQSAIRHLDRIRVRTLLIQAIDDNFVPFAVFEKIVGLGNPCIRLLATRHGGHLGFLSKTRPRFWLDVAIVEWLQENAGTIHEPCSSIP